MTSVAVSCPNLHETATICGLSFKSILVLSPISAVYAVTSIKAGNDLSGTHSLWIDALWGVIKSADWCQKKLQAKLQSVTH